MVRSQNNIDINTALEVDKGLPGSVYDVSLRVIH